MTALVKLIIVSVLSFITGIVGTDKSTEKDSVTEVKTKNCESNNKCVNSSLQGKYDLEVYNIKRNSYT